MKKFISVVGMIILMMSIFAGCGGKEATDQSADNTKASIETIEIVMEIQDIGEMTFELYPEYAPKTVDNFVKLADEGFYDGIIFHRIIKNFMAQGGDPLGNGTGGAENTIEGEFYNNGFKQNTLTHERGVISMARSSKPNSASSQFFIMDANNFGLDGDYAAFGRLIEGEDVLDQIMATPVKKHPSTKEMSVPTEEVKIKTITVIK